MKETFGSTQTVAQTATPIVAAATKATNSNINKMKVYLSTQKDK